ncbi:hypothetical protein [Geodermatophilus sp. URMC 62]|uniref:hypothetical protein n=1 Tax=Geodermatophilus sp. URMC 62 TaxID=3423414 RepID=UPI00406C51FE
MEWAIVAVVGFVLELALVIAMARTNTARWERNHRAAQAAMRARREESLRLRAAAVMAQRLPPGVPHRLHRPELHVPHVHLPHLHLPHVHLPPAVVARLPHPHLPHLAWPPTLHRTRQQPGADQPAEAPQPEEARQPEEVRQLEDVRPLEPAPQVAADESTTSASS